MKRTRWLAPEVIQTASMDCGPAALKALLAGFGIDASYERLREVCQTDVDGTSIDALESLAEQMGLPAAQHILPRDAVVSSAARLSPCIAVTQLPSGGLHFVVLWGQVPGRLQLMDPMMGRRWVTPQGLLDQLYTHEHELPGEDWLELNVQGGIFIPWLRGRLERLGLGEGARRRLEQMLPQGDWRGVAALDAAARMVAWLLSTGHVKAGATAQRLFEHCLEMGRQELETGQRMIPPAHWFARAVPGKRGHVRMRGVVLLVPLASAGAGGEAAPADRAGAAESRGAELRRPGQTALRQLVGLLRPTDWSNGLTLVGALLFSAFGALAELMIFRASFSLVQRLGVTHQRVGALLSFALFLVLLLVLDYLSIGAGQGLGRQMEGRLRLSLLSKLPRLPDAYFRTRLLSDMAQRAHIIHILRTVPTAFRGLLQASFDLMVTVAAISLAQPRLALLTVVGALTSVLIPVVTMRWMVEQETRVQTQQGALMGFYLDALAGLVPLRTHGAAPSLVSEHQKLLGQWYRSASERQTTMTWVSVVQTLTSVLLALALVRWYLLHQPEPQGLLLLLFWAQRIPGLGQTISFGLASFTPIQSALLRIADPLSAAHTEPAVEAAAEPAPGGLAMGLELAFAGVEVVAGGQTVLSGLDLQIGAGEHVAVVGPSGAGKSSLLGLLLGVHAASRGRILVDQQPVRPEELLARLRSSCVWVDPAVHLWNESLLSNIQFGNQDLPQRPIAQVVTQADLIDVLDRLPEGFRSPLGDRGALISGGEGQRVRLARALLRRSARLVLLDEPFRGLDRSKRRKLLTQSRQVWSTATILCVTHDVAETRDFDRVLVLEDGAIVEDGPPEKLLRTRSRYRQLLEADLRAASNVWASEHWRRVRVVEGQVQELPPGEPL